MVMPPCAWAGGSGRRLLADHDGGRVGVAGDHRRHDGRVDHAPMPCTRSSDPPPPSDRCPSGKYWSGGTPCPRCPGVLQNCSSVCTAPRLVFLGDEALHVGVARCGGDLQAIDDGAASVSVAGSLEYRRRIGGGWRISAGSRPLSGRKKMVRPKPTRVRPSCSGRSFTALPRSSRRASPVPACKQTGGGAAARVSGPVPKVVLQAAFSFFTLLCITSLR